jgi:hypothetical protein
MKKIKTSFGTLTKNKAKPTSFGTLEKSNRNSRESPKSGYFAPKTTGSKKFSVSKDFKKKTDQKFDRTQSSYKKPNLREGAKGSSTENKTKKVFAMKKFEKVDRTAASVKIAAKKFWFPSPDERNTSNDRLTGRSAYKAGRSFTRNKKLRNNAPYDANYNNNYVDGAYNPETY